LRRQSVRGTGAINVYFAVRQVSGSVRGEPSYSGENREGATASGGHAVEAKRVVALQIGVVYSGSALGLNRRDKKQRQTHGPQNIHLLHFAPLLRSWTAKWLFGASEQSLWFRQEGDAFQTNDAQNRDENTFVPRVPPLDHISRRLAAP
jgi:hypothetical protein